MKKYFTAFIFLLSCLNSVYSSDKIEIRRFAVFAGANYGGEDRVMLRYAVSDAQAVARVFREMGGVQTSDQVLLIDPTKKSLIAAIEKIQEKIRNTDEKLYRREFVFYYSGHSDDEGILLGDEKYDYKDLKDKIKETPTDMCIVILDSCASGAFTRIKGGKKKPPFLADSSINMRGYAFLTSSSSDEVSQESDKLRGSFFTHYLVSGLRGAADTTRDRRITLNEVYQYAYHETLARTEKSLKGAQHPNYDIQISGSGDVVMTDIRETSAGLKLKKESSGKFYVRDTNGSLVAEINKTEGRIVEIGLEPGEYRVALEKENNYYKGSINLLKGQYKTVSEKVLDKQKKEKTVSRGEAEQNKKDLVKIPFFVSVFPQLSYPACDEQKKIVNNYHLSLVYGKCYHVEGLAWSIGGDVIEGDLSGVQMSCLWNYIGRDAKGVQIGYIGNMIKGELRGVQWGTLGIANKVKGCQLNAVNIAEDLRGLQFGTVSIISNIKGAQVNTVNIAKKVAGAQVAVVNIGREVKGVQVGVVNKGKEVHGPMIGLVNVCDKLDGAPVGLINIIGNGEYGFHVYADEKKYANLDFQHGSRSFYNIFHLGLHGSRKASDIGLGFGFPWNVSATTKAAIECLGMNLHSHEKNYFSSGSNLLAQVRFLMRFSLFRSMDLSMGISYNYFTPFNTEDISLKPRAMHKYYFSWSNDNNYHWPGFFIGMRF